MPLSFQILITDLGVEEMRAIFAIQKTHYIGLTVATQLNQLLLEGALKASAELDLLHDKIITPNSQLNLSELLSQSVEGFNQDLYKKARSMVRGLAQKDAGEKMYPLLTKKNRHVCHKSNRQ